MENDRDNCARMAMQLNAPKIKETVGALLKQLAPNAEEFRISQASNFAFFWIEQYQQDIRQDENSGQWDVAKQTKLELKSLRHAIQKLEQKFANLSPSAVAALPKVWTVIAPTYDEAAKFKVISMGRDDLCSILRETNDAIASSEGSLAKPRYSKYQNRNNILACGMHQVLGNILQLKVAMTHEFDPEKLKPTSANYWRLLRLAMEQAGADPPDDLLPIMREGRRLVGKVLRHGNYDLHKKG